jgi:nucleoside-diphosphate-sugar epimerase
VSESYLLKKEDPILITGSNGFIGSSVVAALLERGFCNLKCFVRPSSSVTRLQNRISRHPQAKVEILKGNLLSPSDCERAVKDIGVIYHLAAGFDKSFAGAFMNSALTTRNLLDAAVDEGAVRRFVNVSSFAVYSNRKLKRGALLDESCPVEDPAYIRGDAYAYGKIKQEEIVLSYARQYGVRFVILRPGAVYGPGQRSITGRVGIDTFGVYLHCGGSNRVPLSYVDNCADAVVLAGLTPNVDGEIFNVVDDDLPSSRTFLRLYKKHVRRFLSIPIPYSVAYALSTLWERYSEWSEGQLPPAFNRSRCSAEWKGNRYSNEKLKRLLGWTPRVPFEQGSRLYFEYQRTHS